MAGLMRLLAVGVAVAALLASPAPVAVSGQPVAGPLSCTASLVSSFAPCLNFIINSTASPTADCCRSLGALMKASTGCACLILTGSVPLGVPVNRTMAVTLPRACNNASVPLQCQGKPIHPPCMAVHCSNSVKTTEQQEMLIVDPVIFADATTSAQTPAPGPVADAPAPSFLAPLRKKLIEEPCEHLCC